MPSRGLVLATLLLSLAIGVAAGLGGYTFVYARGGSYLSDDPQACANCHVMQPQLAAWSRGPHHAVATCNDCHTPHALVPKYWVKALNGWHHSRAFTTGDFVEPIRITARNEAVTQDACRHCHARIVEAIDAAHPDEAVDCIRCHQDVGHAH